MNKRLRDRWIAALRSGKYKQGNGALKSNDPDDPESAQYYFCCLGVLREIDPKIKPRPGARNSYLDEKSSGISKETQLFLAQMNDGSDGQKERGFRGIAQWIERNL